VGRDGKTITVGLSKDGCTEGQQAIKQASAK